MNGMISLMIVSENTRVGGTRPNYWEAPGTMQVSSVNVYISKSPHRRGFFTPKNSAYGVEIESLVLEINVPTS